MKSELNNISTIIFDLGGVVLNLNPKFSLNAFANLSGLSEKEVYTKFVEDGWSYAFEKGEIDAPGFRDEVRKSLGQSITDKQIDDSWNAMLLDLPIARLEMIANLRSDYQTLVLSNTNEIHIKAFDKIVAEATEGGSIAQFFDNIYYSHEVGMRKPDSEIYNFVLAKNNLKPHEVLFIDDMEVNIIGAREVGMKTVLMTDQNYLFELFS